MIASLGRAEAESMLTDDRGATMTCGFCNENYVLDETALTEIIAGV
jgi:redox-regulated HSP33 family molecular chaperone